MTLRQDLTVRQGATWAYSYTHRDLAGAIVDLSGFTARMMVKAAFNNGYAAYLSSGSDANGGTITLGGVLGTVALSMTAAQSAALGSEITLIPTVDADEPSIIYRYDLELISAGGVVIRPLEGRFILLREVTA